MLPIRLLDVEIAGGRVVPRWLGRADEAWLTPILAELAVAAWSEPLRWRIAAIGRAHGVGARTLGAVSQIERRRRPARLGVGPLHAPLNAAAAVARYNLELARSLLARAADVTATWAGDPRPVVTLAKREGLLPVFEAHGDGTRARLPGPLAFVRDAARHAAALGRFLPVLAARPGWSLSARVVLGDVPRTLAIDSCGPTITGPPRSLGRSPHAGLARQLASIGCDWRFEKTDETVCAGERVFFPDFALASPRARVLVDVVTCSTPDYLATARAALDRASAPAKVLFCVGERGEERRLADPLAVAYRRVIDAARLVSAIERVI